MKHIFTLLFLLFATIAFAQNSQENMDWQWAHRFGGSNNPQGVDYLRYNNHPHNLVLDEQGNSYLFGTYGGGTQFNGEALQVFTDYACGAFIAKFDCNGDIIWHKAIARSEQRNCEAQYMILKNNHIYIQGTVHIDISYQTWFLDTLVSGRVLSNHQEDNVFPWIPNSNYTYIMELDLDGNIIEYNLFESSQTDSQSGLSASKVLYESGYGLQLPFSIDNQGNYYLLLQHTYNIDRPQNFVIKQNGAPITDTMVSNTYNGYYVLKFDHNFNFQYIKPITEYVHSPYWSIITYFYDMECDSEDNIYFAGHIQIRDTASNPLYPYDVELADGKHIYIHSNGRHGVVMKMNSDGEILWASQARNYGVYSMNDFQNMLLDENSNNIFVAGFSSTTDSYESITIFGNNDTIANNYDGEHSEMKDITEIIACYDTDGNYKWYSCPSSISCDIGGMASYNGKIYAAVIWASFGLIFDGQTYYPSMQVQTGTFINGYGICEWDIQGNMTNVNQIYSTGTGIYTEPYDTRINSMGNIYTTGRFNNIMAFGEDTIREQHESDMFIAKFGLPCPTYIFDTATYCYGEVVQGVTLTASGDYTFVYPEGGQEIDSIVLVHATVLPPLTIGLSDTTVCTAQQFYLDACGDFDSYLWSTGGTGCTEMLQFDNACTQSVTLTVTRGECSASKTISITAQVCDGITEPSTTAMSLYPNPASDMVTIFGDGFVRATVIDIAGRILLSTTAMTIDISGLRPGEYVVKVERINGETEELKMVKE